MSVRHHPDEELLLAYATGRTDAEIALILATHLSFCAQCSASVALAERVGGILLDEIAPASLAPDALKKVLARLEMPVTSKIITASNDNTPEPLRSFIGRDLSEMRWRKIGPHLSYVTLYRRGPLAVRLLRGAPGSNVGQHTHRGTEYTVVLRGGFTDATGNYGPGDFQIASGDVKHNPIADLDGECVNLTLTTEPLQFDGLIHKIVGRLFGF
jgi:putative transcriptional regulator